MARSLDVEQEHLAGVLRQAALHRGTAFVEIYQNCVTFNDGAYDFLTDRAIRDDTRLLLEHGKPLVFGKERNRGRGRAAGAGSRSCWRAERRGRSSESTSSFRAPESVIDFYRRKQRSAAFMQLLEKHRPDAAVTLL